jgi:GT2 family glycosyltransferase
VVVPAFGSPDVTADVVRDLSRESAYVMTVVVDNGGDYEQVAGETVLRPGQNLGWLRGSNTGARHLLAAGSPDMIVMLNNDTRLSDGFMAGLIAAGRARRVGLVGPCYDDVWYYPRIPYDGAASAYNPGRWSWRVPFLDGTCLAIPRRTIHRVGLLDESSFGTTGWGADVDYALRVRRAGLQVRVTRRSYLQHARATTAQAVHGDKPAYWDKGNRDMSEGLAAKWGKDWAAQAGISRGSRRALPGRVLGRLEREVGRRL